MSIFSAIPGALASLAGGFMGMEGAQSAAAQNAAAQEQMNSQNLAWQQEFAQNGIQWKVEDAAKAGLSPLAAIGAPTQSFTNLVAPQPGAPNAGAAMGKGLADAGQNISRALQSTQSADDQAYTNASRALALQKGQLENDLLASQIRTANQPANPPSMPAPSQVYMGGIPDAHTVVPGTSAIEVKPDAVTAAGDRAGVVTAGAHPEVSMGNTAWGGYYPEPSRDMSVAMFNPWSQLSWSYRNLLAPTWDDHLRPKDMSSDKYYYDPITGYIPKSGDFYKSQYKPYVDAFHKYVY